MARQFTGTAPTRVEGHAGDRKALPYLAPHRLAQATRDWTAAGAYQTPIEEVRARAVYRMDLLARQRRIGIACCVLSALVVVYFVGQLARLAF